MSHSDVAQGLRLAKRVVCERRHAYEKAAFTRDSATIVELEGLEDLIERLVESYEQVDSVADRVFTEAAEISVKA